MPLQNRVTPFNTLEAVPDRGTLMGNRGILHDAEGRVGASTWTHQTWLCCLTTYKDSHREPMPAGRYTALFFLDEAVALAAGHRPCCLCRRADYQAFVAAWRIAATVDPARKLRAGDIDAALHAARVGPGRRQARHAGRLGDLPDGSFVTPRDEPAAAFLLWDGMLHRWSHAGYGGTVPADGAAEVEVLTPSPTVGALRAGYRPRVHPSVTARGARPPVG